MSKIPLICNKCGHIWYQSINGHINNRSGCPMCSSSKGELACMDYLISLKLAFKPQAQIISLPTRYYDFMFIHNNISYLLEFDGKQHFEFFHDDIGNFIQTQTIDILKT